MLEFGTITMSLREVNRLEVFEQVASKRITQVEGGRRLGLGKGQMIRLFKAYRTSGACGLISKRRGQPSNNRLSEGLKSEALALLKEHYIDFGPTFAHEKLTEVHGLQLSVESLRQLMVQSDLWKGKQRREVKVHQMRTRRSSYGELVQIDGSPHAWFEDRGPRCTLLVFVDDATGKLMQLHFEPEESTQGYFDASRKYFSQHGRPVAFYSDKHGIFRVNIKEAKSGTGETQFGRAMRELDIQVFHANSPQAKGRVERMNGTLQDRLIKEMRLKGISDIAAANTFAPTYIAAHNKRFSVAARSPVDAHRKALPDAPVLGQILCQRHIRTLTKNLEAHYNNKVYQIQIATQGYAMRGAKVHVCDQQGKVTILYKQRVLSYTIFDKGHRTTPIVSSKQINSRVQKHVKHKPSVDHPWRSRMFSGPKARFKTGAA